MAASAALVPISGRSSGGLRAGLGGGAGVLDGMVGGLYLIPGVILEVLLEEVEEVDLRGRVRSTERWAVYHPAKRQVSRRFSRLRVEVCRGLFTRLRIRGGASREGEGIRGVRVGMGVRSKRRGRGRGGG